MTEGPVLLAIQGGIARLTFDRPETLNAINRECAEGLLAAFETIASNESVRVVLMRGNGRAFMAGGDVSTFDVGSHEAPAYFATLFEPVHAAVQIMMGLEVPVIAAVHGAVAGAGLSVAMAADLVIASAETRFTMGYSKLGVSADGSISWSLPRLIGLRRAMEMALLSDVYDAEQALRWGLVNQVIAEDQFSAATEALVQRLAAGPTVALGKMKQLMRLSFDRDLPSQLAAEEKALTQCVVTEDFIAGVRGFNAKSKPVFRGK